MYYPSMSPDSPRHWWNGRWGRIARRDIYLRADGDRYVVEAREGGADGNRADVVSADRGGRSAARRRSTERPGRLAGAHRQAAAAEPGQPLRSRR